jgi:hypothetical protein
VRVVLEVRFVAGVTVEGTEEVEGASTAAEDLLDFLSFLDDEAGGSTVPSPAWATSASPEVAAATAAAAFFSFFRRFFSFFAAASASSPPPSAWADGSSEVALRFLSFLLLLELGSVEEATSAEGSVVLDFFDFLGLISAEDMVEGTWGVIGRVERRASVGRMWFERSQAFSEFRERKRGERSEAEFRVHFIPRQPLISTTYSTWLQGTHTSDTDVEIPHTDLPLLSLQIPPSPLETTSKSPSSVANAISFLIANVSSDCRIPSQA